ncbi:MAG: AtpZ/AtpI family protein [Thomasclavelia sp.]|jgi:F0F1-type ATP synthase assembly protein I|nr:AtpZ/AtpI family protein [Thomasclavelia sp.]
MNDDRKKLLRDLAFGLSLGIQVIGSFLVAVVLGLRLDEVFNSKPICILVLLVLAFIYVIKLLLGVGKR